MSWRPRTEVATTKCIESPIAGANVIAWFARCRRWAPARNVTAWPSGSGRAAGRELEPAMLFMVVNTHHAESCAFRSAEDARAIMEPWDRFTDGLAAANGITVKGSWINRPAHEGFLLVDAPSAHLVDDVLVESGIIGRSHTRVLSVIATDDVQVPDEETVAVAGGRG